MAGARSPGRPTAALPPGPTSSSLLQTLRWVARPVFGVEDRAAAEQLRGVLRGMLEWVTEPSRLLMMALLGPERTVRWPAARSTSTP